MGLYDSQAQKRYGNFMSTIPSQLPGRQQAQGSSDLVRMLGSLAPAAGGIIGGIAGGPAGAMIGSGIGSGVQSIANYGADQTMRPYDENEAKRQARMQAINGILAAMRPGGGGSF